MPKCCFENFPSLKSSKTRVIILNISFKIQLYRPNKHLYDTLVTTSSLQCKNILKNFVVNEKTAKIQQQEKSRSLSTFAEKHARASPFPHHTSISATSARFTAHYISALFLTYYLALILGVHAAWSLIFALAWQTLRRNAVLLMPILNYIQCIRFS